METLIGNIDASDTIDTITLLDGSSVTLVTDCDRIECVEGCMVVAYGEWLDEFTFFARCNQIHII